MPQSQERQQVTLLLGRLDDFIGEDNPVRVVDAFVEELDLTTAGFDGRLVPPLTDRPAYHPSVLSKVYIYGYLNRVQSSPRLERECQRNVELMWWTGRLAHDCKTIANFAATTVAASARRTASSWPSAASSSCSSTVSSWWTAASSRRSTTAAATSRRTIWSSG